MSLIHDALREIDKGNSPATGASDFRALAPAGAASARWVPFAGGLAAVLAVAAVGGWAWQKAQAPAPLTALAAAPAVVAPSTSLAPSPSLAPAASAPVVLADASAAPALAVPPERAAMPMQSTAATAPTGATTPAAPSAPAARPAAARASQPADRPLRNARPAKPVAQPVAADAPPPVPVEKRYALFLAAMKTGDLAGAREQLTALQSQIPPGTLSRLRAEAWFALQSGNEADARRSYQDILERAPGDEEAGINLASIEARNGRREAARQVLTDALANNPGSEALLATLARFKAPARN
jgi:hypothetical protein